MIISEGNTNNYLIPGLGVLILAGGLLTVSVFIALPVFIASIAMFAGKNGLELVWIKGFTESMGAFLDITLEPGKN